MAGIKASWHWSHWLTTTYGTKLLAARDLIEFNRLRAEKCYQMSWELGADCSEVWEVILFLNEQQLLFESTLNSLWGNQIKGPEDIPQIIDSWPCDLVKYFPDLCLTIFLTRVICAVSSRFPSLLFLIHLCWHQFGGLYLTSENSFVLW